MLSHDTYLTNETCKFVSFPLLFMMSGLKRKTENDGEITSPDPASTSVSPKSADPSQGASSSCREASDGAHRVSTPNSTNPDTHVPRIDSPQTINICGEEVLLKRGGGRKKRKLNRDTLIFMTYKARLAEMCRADNMLAALDIYKEMKSKRIFQDLEVSIE